MDRLRAANARAGWVEGHIRDRVSLGRGAQRTFERACKRLVRLNVDVIVTHNTPGPLAAKQATSTIPIVFATACDPIGTGIVANSARPGGNVTGLSS